MVASTPVPFVWSLCSYSQVLIARKLILYRTGWYGQNLPYRCLGQYKNVLVSFRFKYQLYRSRFGHTRINIGFQLENRYRAKQKKLRKPPKFQDPPPHSYLSFSFPSSYLSLLCISSSFPLFRWPLFLQPLHLLHLILNVCLSLFLVLVHSLESTIKKQVTRLQSKTCGSEKKNEINK